MPSKELHKWSSDENMGPTEWSLTKLGLWESRRAKGGSKKANLARGYIRSLALHEGVSDQSSLGIADWHAFIIKCVTSCQQLRHLEDQIKRWVAGTNVTKDLEKVAAALEYIVQEALRAGRNSGAISSSKKRRADAITDLNDEAGPSTSSKRAAATDAPPIMAVRAVFVCPDSATRTDKDSQFPFLWPQFDHSLVRTITSFSSPTLEALVKSLVANMPSATREIRSIWGVTVEQAGNTRAPEESNVFLLDSDAAVQGWVLGTSNFLERTVYLVYRRQTDVDNPRPDTPILGNRPFFSRAAVLPKEKDVYFDIGEDEDNELAALRKEPKSLPWARTSLQTKERIVAMRIIRQQRLLQVLRARARGFYDDWSDTEVDDDEVTWLSENRYLVDPPKPGTEELPLR
jgi:hypothetical protein